MGNTKRRLILFCIAIIGIAIGSRFLQSQSHLTRRSLQGTQDRTSDQETHRTSRLLLTSAQSLSFNDHKEAEKKIKILEEIFQSKNDNDPRLDQEFNQLSDADKAALEKKYTELKQESRNERGTIVFLIGKTLNSEKDFDFMKKVLSEAPCLSLSDCSRATGPSGDQESHLSDVNKITLEYPQIVAMKSIERYLSSHPPSSTLIQVLQEAGRSKSPIVSQMATSLAGHISN
jgi:hypothetical protein